MTKYRLMVPGPTPLPPEVSAAAVAPIEDERTAQYACVFTRVVHNLKRVLLTSNELLLFTSSMTGAFEGVVQNLFCPGDAVLVVNNGAFGQRWVELAGSYGLQVVEVRQPWGERIDPERVAAAVATHPELVAAIAVHCETSTGVVNDIAGFALATRHLVSVVDSAAGVGACELRTDEWGVDVVVGGCQKALMTPPGLAFVSISPRAWALHQRATLARYYFDWDITRDALRAEIARTPWTPAISLISQLDAALERLHDEGMDEVLARHAHLGRVARAGVRGMGLRLFSPDDDRAAALTTAELPATVDGAALVDHMLADYGVQVAGGQGQLAGRIIRIGHCGYIDAFDVLSALGAVELSLHRLGHPIDVGRGVGAAMRVMARSRRAGRTSELVAVPINAKGRIR